MTVNRLKILLVIFGLILFSAILLNTILENRQATPATGSIVDASSFHSTGFDRALPPADINFPADFGPHPEFQTEWWYYTGNLSAEDGRRFGYQLTIFRRALVPERFITQRASNWGTTQIYMGHFALTDAQENSHHYFEKLSRDAVGISGAQADPYRVWIANWAVEEQSPGHYHMIAQEAGISIDLLLEDQKGPVLHGIQGYSQKGPDPGNASYYYSQTRLETKGTITIDRKPYFVEGWSWKDHEYSTSALSENQVGWDWFALQIDNDTELKVFNIRREDGSVDPYSSGSFIDQRAIVTSLASSEFKIIPLETWRSNRTKADYPSAWEIVVPSLGLSVNVRPLIDNQELNLSYSYWEGAVYFSGELNGTEITGYGYAELTGYAQSMAGEF
jgi:predicted secreted hydrolase